jgi:crotonobetainyl-CoA:carnitine CoA-transferase CaiB-like acyl-CoA transferase
MAALSGMAALAGIAVLDFSIWRPGPYATSLLCGLGADVLKVEPPGGDPMRHYPALFDSVNAGKRSVMFDLTSEADRSRAWELALSADVIVEGFRPGVMDRLGVGAGPVREANPRVVYCSISGYGQDGWRASLPGHDINYQGWAGSLSPEGGVAVKPPLPVADLASGMTAAFGICAALLGRASSGLGAYLDVSMTGVMATWTGSAGSGSVGSGSADAGGAVERGNDTAVPGYGLFPTADGHQVALGVVNEQHFWQSLCRELGLSEWADIDFAERNRRGAELNGRVAAAVAGRQRDELVESLCAAGVPVAPVLSRAGMVTQGLFTDFPLSFGGLGVGAGVAGTRPAVPTLDQHRGEGFLA